MLIPGWPILLPLVMFSTNVLLIHIITLYVLILNRHRDNEKKWRQFVSWPERHFFVKYFPLKFI